MVQINTRDLRLVTQRQLNLRVKIDVYDERNNNHLEQLECGIVNATFSISADSDVRRTSSLTVIPIKNKRLRFEKDGIIWMNRIIKMQIGIEDIRNREYVYYKNGTYVFMNYGATYDASNNQIELSLSDLWANFDGSRNGEIGGVETISFPAYEEDPDTGEVIKYNYIRDAIITTLLQLGKLKESQLEISEIGEFKGMEQYNPDYLQYREESNVQVKDGSYMPIWNAIPFDQEFGCGVTVSEILTAFRDLYPNYEMFFNEDTFVCQMIPSCYEDDIIFDYNFFDRIYISENTTVDMSKVRNVCEVFGKVIDADYFTEQCTYSDNCYSCTIEGYEEDYYNGDIVGITIPSENQVSATININNFGIISIYDENTEEPIKANLMESGQIYTFKIKKKYIDGENVTRCYFLGQFQPHAVNILTNGTTPTEDYTAQDGTVVKKYSKEYFQKIYNCKTIEFTTVKDSPFSIEELGVLPSTKTGGEFENITSDSLAAARAEYENWKNSRLTDSISITTKIVPFADVNIKVSYRRNDTGEINQYIVKSLSHDLSGGTTSWTLMRFYPLYKSTSATAGTWDSISTHTWEELSNYTWNDIMT